MIKIVIKLFQLNILTFYRTFTCDKSDNKIFNTVFFIPGLVMQNGIGYEHNKGYSFEEYVFNYASLNNELFQYAAFHFVVVDQYSSF